MIWGGNDVTIKEIKWTVSVMCFFVVVQQHPKTILPDGPWKNCFPKRFHVFHVLRMRPKDNFTLSKWRLSWYLQALGQVFYSKDASSYIKWFINIKQRFVPEILRVQAEFHSAAPQERHTGFRTCHWGRTFHTWWKPSQLTHHKCVSLLFYTSAEYKSRNKITEQ